MRIFSTYNEVISSIVFDIEIIVRGEIVRFNGGIGWTRVLDRYRVWRDDDGAFLRVRDVEALLADEQVRVDEAGPSIAELPTKGVLIYEVVTAAAAPPSARIVRVDFRPAMWTPGHY